MNAISIGYRFSRDELCALLQAMQINGLPGAPLSPVDADTAARVLDRFAGEGIAVVADGTLYIDKLVGYLLRAAANATKAVALTDGSRTAVLWNADRLLILGDFPDHGECALTPLQNEETAKAALVDVICRMLRPLWAINVYASDRRETLSPDSSLSEEQIAVNAMALMA